MSDPEQASDTYVDHLWVLTVYPFELAPYTKLIAALTWVVGAAIVLFARQEGYPLGSVVMAAFGLMMQLASSLLLACGLMARVRRAEGRDLSGRSES